MLAWIMLLSFDNVKKRLIVRPMRETGYNSNMAQRKRAGLITRRSLDRNEVLLFISVSEILGLF